MQQNRKTEEAGNVLICVLGTILVVSLIGANVLSSSTTRLNAATSHVRAWKESLSAAETGGDIAFAEIKKKLSNDAAVRASQWSGWTNSGGTHTSPEVAIASNNLKAGTVVEE